MPVVVSPPAYEANCSELWADPTEFSTETGATVEEATQAILEATYVLWSLTYYRFHGWQCWTQDFSIRRSQCFVALPKSPVERIIEVSHITSFGSTGAEGLEPVEWTFDGDRINICGSTGGFLDSGLLPAWCRGSATALRVRYQIAPNLPPGADRVTARLAGEYYKAACGLPCKLPERITAVTREGVSWTVLDPQDFLKDGLLGIGPIDQWIAMVNRRGVATVIDRMVSGRVLYSHLDGCGEECAE